MLTDALVFRIHSRRGGGVRVDYLLGSARGAVRDGQVRSRDIRSMTTARCVRRVALPPARPP